MAAKKDLEALLARIEAAVKAGDACDLKKKPALIRDIRELKAGLKEELHGPSTTSSRPSKRTPSAWRPSTRPSSASWTTPPASSPP
jgi:hypothetical protein